MSEPTKAFEFSSPEREVLRKAVQNLDLKLGTFETWMRPGERPNKTQIQSLVNLAQKVVSEYWKLEAKEMIDNG